MGSVTNIAQALVDVCVDYLSDVDYGSVSDFYPAVQTQKIAVIALPFAQASTSEPESFGTGELVMIHRLRLEFWVKHTQGTADATMQRARDVATEAAVV